MHSIMVWTIAVLLSLLTAYGCVESPPAPPTAPQKEAVTKKKAPSVHCQLEGLPVGARVYAVGIYAGLEPLPVELGGSGRLVSQAEVVVTDEERPVVLVLMNHDPVVWRVGKTDKAKIAAILATGRYRPAVIGVRKSVPIRILSGETKSNCRAFSAYEAGPELLKSNRMIKQYTGHEMHKFVFHAFEGRFFAGPEKRLTESEIKYSDDLKLDSYVRSSSLPTGVQGLAKMEQEGAIRRATAEDIAAWEKGANEKYARFNKELRVNHKMVPGETYVLLKQTRLPKALQGQTFIVPKGIKIPPSASNDLLFYLMQKFECRKGTGAPCP